MSFQASFQSHVFSAAEAAKRGARWAQVYFNASPTVFISLFAFFFSALCSLLLTILVVSSSSPLLSSLSVTLCLCIRSPGSVGSHVVLCEASYQHQQQEGAEPVLSCSKATEQRETDGLCSQMCSASVPFVCVWAHVCDLQDGVMDAEKGNERD